MHTTAVKEQVNCIVCSTLITVKPSRLERTKGGLTCSRKCRGELLRNIYLGAKNPNYRKGSLSDLEIFFNDKFSKLRHTAKQRGLEFQITSTDLLNLYKKQNGLCCYTGLPMSLVTTKDWNVKRQADPDILSVDRVNSSLGYTAGNIVLCCIAVNKMKSANDFLDIQGFINALSNKVNNCCDIRIKKVNPNAILPDKAKIGDAGYDLFAATVEDQGNFIKVGTGIAIQSAPGWYSEVYDRSSNVKKRFMLHNSVGIIDNGYTGEIMLFFFKTDPNAKIEIGDRVAQLIPKRFAHVTFTEVNGFDDTQRGSGGFGSSGV